MLNYTDTFGVNNVGDLHMNWHLVMGKVIIEAHCGMRYTLCVYNVCRRMYRMERERETNCFPGIVTNISFWSTHIVPKCYVNDTRIGVSNVLHAY